MRTSLISWWAVVVLFAVGAGVMSATAQDIFAVRAAGRKILPLQKKLGPPEVGDWLADHREWGQTFDEYIATNPNRPTKQRSTIYLQPIGSFDQHQQRLLDDTIELMGHFFGTPIKQLEPIALDVFPPGIRNTKRGWDEIMADYVLVDVLTPRQPKDAVAVLALTPADLWVGDGGRFVFGKASLSERVGVWSLSRFGDPERDYVRTLRRTLATATHETGHMLGIPHCIAFECGMNGKGNIDETDRRRMGFCFQCEQKIWWGCKVDPVKRGEALVNFMTRRGLEREAHEWQRELDALKMKP